MDTTLVIELVIALLALAIHAIAGVAELGGDIFSRRRALEMQEEIRSGKRTTFSLVEGARAYRASMVVVRLASAIIAAVMIQESVERVFDHYHLALNALFLLIGLVIAGIGLPRVILYAASDGTIDFCVRFTSYLARICRPLVALGDILVAPLKLLLPGRDGVVNATEDEVREAAGLTREDEALQEAEQRMIDGVLELEELRASDIMVPRLDMVAASVDIPPAQILQIITTTGHSRIPIYDQSIDDMLGVLHAKDLLPFVTRNVRDVRIRPLLRPAYIVPESKRVDELLRDMRRQRLQIAVVADEYGGIAGIVTIEDIVEEIIGEIHDEYDPAVEEEEMVELSDNAIEVSGGVVMHEIVDHFELELESFDDVDYDTVGGFVLKYLERLPATGDTFEAGGLRVEVLRVERHRVRRVRIDRIVEEPGDVENENTERSFADE